MQFIRTLFCWHGADQQLRFFLIGLVSFFTFILLSHLFAYHYLASFPLLLLFSTLCLFSAHRRISQAPNAQWLVYLSSILLLIIGIIKVLFAPYMGYSLFLLPLVLYLSLLKFGTSSEKDFIFGYAGSVDLHQYKSAKSSATVKNKRIEPTLFNTQTTNIPEVNATHSESALNSAAHSNTFLAELTQKSNLILQRLGHYIHALFFVNNTPLYLRLTAIALILVLSIVPLFFHNVNKLSSSEESNIEQVIQEASPSNKYLNQLSLPDNFSLMTTIDNGLIIQWEGDIVENGDLWQLINASGDRSCQNITFNSGNPIRTAKVIVTESNLYHALFSPLDTTTLIKHIAFKGRFSLCGYTFSLKGSQAVLGKMPYYRNLISY